MQGKYGTMIVVKYQVHNSASQGGVYLHFNTKNTHSQAVDMLGEMAKKRRANDRTAPWMEKHVSEAALANFKHCGDYLVFLEDETREHKKLEVGFFCKQRLCPGCGWRASLASAKCLGAIAAKMEESGRVMLMCTLTVRNVGAEDLTDTIRRINRAWSKMLKREIFKPWADYVRKLEVTYNKDSDTYHPHLHVILFVTQSYFGKRYISQRKLLEAWRSAYGDQNITNVDIRRCKSYKDGSNAVLEVAKYTAKSSDYTQSETVFDAMYQGLYHARLMEYAGACKTLRDDYRKGKLEMYEQADTTLYTMRVVYIWSAITNAYDEHDVQAYDMSAAQLARLQRDEKRLATYAMAEADRLLSWSNWLSLDWVRALRDADEIEVAQ